MKKNIVKNRKTELKKKRTFFVCCVVGVISVVGSLVLSYILFLSPSTYLSPLVFATRYLPTSTETKDIIPYIKQTMKDLKMQYKDVRRIDGITYEISLDTDEKVVITSSKDIYQQLTSLQLITSRLTMEGKRFSRLDLRYDKPVIVF